MNNTLRKILNFDLLLTQRVSLQSAEHPFWQPAVFLAHSGDSWIWAVVVGIAWLFSTGHWHRFLAILEISIIFQALFVFGFKRLFHRPRPNGSWGEIYRLYDPHSFPSGHATRAALVTFLALAMGPLWLGVALLIWAPLVCLSRVMTGVHYLSDVIGGILLGLIMGPVLVACSPLLMQWFPFLF